MKTILYFYESAFTMWRRRLAGIYAIARAEGWHVESIDVGELKRGVRSVLKYWKPDGVIVDGGIFRHAGCEPRLFSDLPVVYCDADKSEIGTACFVVRQDSEDVTKKAITELLMRNFSDYGYVHYRTRRGWTMEREDVFCLEMRRRNRKPHVFRSWDCGRHEDVVVLKKRLVEFVAGLPKPCGILAANDEMAVHVLRAAESAGISVPEDMAVMGIDNDELVCENTSPTLSSVAPAFERSGKLAAGLLARRFRVPALKPIELKFGSLPVERRHSTRKTERVDMRAVRAVEYVRANACKGIMAADVVRQMGMKVRMAEYRFREVAKRSIRDEIVAVRVARAKDLLRNSKMSVNDIYLKCGYRDPRSLRAVFTKTTGCSLLQWRNRKK